MDKKVLVACLRSEEEEGWRKKREERTHLRWRWCTAGEENRPKGMSVLWDLDLGGSGGGYTMIGVRIYKKRTWEVVAKFAADRVLAERERLLHDELRETV
jgi:hypothetical protein